MAECSSGQAHVLEIWIALKLVSVEASPVVSFNLQHCLEMVGAAGSSGTLNFYAA